jgi:hypothetical protein
MINQIKNLFPAEIDSIKCIDKFDSFKLEYETKLSVDLSKNSLEETFNKLKDKWILKIEITNFETPIQLVSISEIETFIDLIESEKKDIDDEKIFLRFNINKEINNDIIYVYDNDSFFKYIDSLKVEKFLNVLSKLFNKKKTIFLESFVSNQKNIKFKSSRISFNSEIDEDLSIRFISENCYYVNKLDFPFSPDFFYLSQRPEIENSLSIIMDKCSMVFNIISLSDYSSIKDNLLNYKISGYKTIEDKIDCQKIDYSSLKTFNKISNWIYNDLNKISDKLGLSRNILSIYLKDKSLKLNIDAYYSIQSGYKTYLQSNLNKYIDVREKITNQLEDINKKANDSIEQVLNNYQKSNYAFISFFISIFVLRVLSKGNFDNVFTKDATYISFLLIFMSIIYLFYSLWFFKAQKKRLIKKYKFLKERFEDLLIKEDIDKILRGDKEFRDEINFIKKRKKLYTTIWIITIILFFSLIFTLSETFNWEFLFEKIKLTTIKYAYIFNLIL